MFVLIIVLFVIISILLMPLGIRIQKNDYSNDVDIFLTKFFNIRIDFDDFIRLFLTSRKNRDEVTLESIINNIKLYKEFQNIIDSAFKHSHIKNFTIIIKGKFTEVDYETYFKVSSQIFFEVLNEYLLRTFKKVNNTYYSVQPTKSDLKTMIVIETYIYVRTIYIIKAFLVNMRETIKIIKLIRRSE